MYLQSTPSFTPASNSLSSDNPLSRSVIWGTLVNIQDGQPFSCSLSY